MRFARRQTQSESGGFNGNAFVCIFGVRESDCGLESLHHLAVHAASGPEQKALIGVLSL